MERTEQITGLTAADEVEWRVEETTASGVSIQSVDWSFTVADISCPGIGGVGGVVPCPNILKTVIAVDNKLYYGII